MRERYLRMVRIQITKIGSVNTPQWPRYLIDTDHPLIRGMEMGRINNIIQRHVDERIEQKQALLTERVEKLEKTVLELKSEISEIMERTSQEERKR